LILTEVTDDLRFGDQRKNVQLIWKLICQRDFGHKEMLRLIRTDSRSKWWSECSPEAFKSPANVALEAWDKSRHRAFS